MKREDDDFEQLEALFARRVPKGLVGNVLKGIKDLKKELQDHLSLTLDIKTKNFASGSGNGKEWVFLAIKENDSALEENVPEEKELATKIKDKDEWVIDSGYSHHMTRDKGKFLSLQEFDGGLVIFGDDEACMIKGKGTISLDGKNTTDNVYKC
ncbi:hypothetical protein SUGI_0759360 [Cryptomeria japonica]|nr:hypothetical protein SUGI_0759360 [Cryptomeria japonica]